MPPERSRALTRTRLTSAAQLLLLFLRSLLEAHTHTRRENRRRDSRELRRLRVARTRPNVRIHSADGRRRAQSCPQPLCSLAASENTIFTEHTEYSDATSSYDYYRTILEASGSRPPICELRSSSASRTTRSRPNQLSILLSIRARFLRSQWSRSRE